MKYVFVDITRTHEEIYRLTTFQAATQAVNGSELAGRGFYYIHLTHQIQCFRLNIELI